MKKRNGGFLRVAVVVLNLGLSLVGASLVGMYLGSFVDAKTSSRIYTPIGLLVGLALGLHRSWYILKDVTENKK
ncbi:MAG TPA: AtpZ/AtpI family protein [Bacillota bacterium]|nr:hypothetical protein [Candidatus Fermentithermobacillaceae bacterium]HOB30836.1 AtpZ/AtpI family protein [Bacillota bacterium]HOK64597.1 AtpZ/AtpI family protein [Bacillota bacterium]HOL12150.1 AtpZ/AtpI family protein [Bacillota bacterium]HOQ03264.1 AtpZ/AtpI family protein [Bacillota bacterium]